MSAEPTAASGPTTWAAWEDAVVDAVRALPDDGSLVLVAPRVHTRMARPAGAGRLARLLGGRKRPVTPSVRLVRAEDHLRGHWVGAVALGGTFPWTPAEVDAVLAAGWHRPTVGDGEDFVRFWPDDVPSGPYLPEADARRAAAALADTFRTVLAVDEDDLPALRPA
ncbi:TY-Chap domain-containing protein [Phycicoccus avicenniae]|uniref:TY-Chap domain-containing protein n=1 Tax=Phycicoccus avicenniae TaxID=2828860 RepID=UPI003D2DF44E